MNGTFGVKPGKCQSMLRGAKRRGNLAHRCLRCFWVSGLGISRLQRKTQDADPGHFTPAV